MVDVKRCANCGFYLWHILSYEAYKNTYDAINPDGYGRPLPYKACALRGHRRMAGDKTVRIGKQAYLTCDRWVSDSSLLGVSEDNPLIVNVDFDKLARVTTS